jgi:predicted Zn finger-like uncharacterized protein
MRLTCPNCGARYEVDDALIPPEGRDVQCSDCVTTWFQAGPRAATTEPQAPRPPFPAPTDAVPADAADTVAEAEFAEDTTVEPPPPEPAQVDPAEVVSDGPAPELEPGPESEVTIPREPETDPEPAPAQASEPPAPPDMDGDPHEGPLTELPEHAESATQVVAENDLPEPEEPDETEVASEPVGRREIDPDVRDILRAEAEREARLRQPTADPVETQSEMPLDAAPEDTTLARRRAELEGAEDAFTVGAASAAHANGSRRDLLPDIEEINSTLRATEDRRGTEAGDDAAALERSSVAHRRRGVRLGFFATLALMGALIWVYFNADMLGQNVPAVAGAVDGFTSQVDVARYWLDDLARGLAASEDGS